jgi:3-oxoacyl-[acyl-carrier-protein] synthase II
MTPHRAAVVTGLGAVSAFGWGVDALAAGLREGRCGIGEVHRLDVRGHRTSIAAGVPDPPVDILRSIPSWHHLSWSDRFAVAAALEACQMAEIELSGTAAAVVFGGSAAGMFECEEYIGRLLGARPGRPRLHDLASQQINGPGDAVARHLGVHGPVLTLSSACASGGLAIGTALDLLRDGEAEVVVAGGADALCQLTYGGFNSLRSVSPTAARPFRADRDGLSVGEGAGILILETADHAARRGARPLGRLLGWGASCDAHHMTAPHPEGAGAAAAVAVALQSSGVDPAAISFVNAHGTGTPLNDAAEAHAIHTSFGERARSLPVTAPKAAIGHLLGASGAIEAVATLLALSDHAVQPTPGDAEADPELGLDLVVGRPRTIEASAIGLSLCLAFGGANAALVVASPEPV